MRMHKCYSSAIMSRSRKRVVSEIFQADDLTYFLFDLSVYK